MAIPLIIGGIAAATGLYKGTKAVKDNNQANHLNDRANEIVRHSEEKLNKSRKSCQKSLEDLGSRKINALGNHVKNFLETFSQIKNVDFSHDGNLGNLALKEFSQEKLQMIQESVSFIASSGLGAGTGIAGGALTAFGAYSGTMAFAAAGTGTAISTLSGAAATNATLAWLGGGTLASGGMGVAGGMMALGALTAGPALLIAGWYIGSKAESKLNDAYTNKAKAEEFRESANAAIEATNGIQSVANKSSEILSVLCKHSRRNLRTLKEVIDTKGCDYSQYGETDKTVVLKNVKIIQVIKALIDTAILDEKGNILGDANSKLTSLENCINNDFKGDIIEA